MKRFLLASAALLSVNFANAAGPMYTQSANVLDRGTCEGEALLGRSNIKVEGFKEHTTFGGLRAECGVLDGTQIGLSGTRIKILGDRFDSLGLIGKTRLWDGGPGAGKLALTYGIQGVRDSDLDFDYAASEIGLAYTQTFVDQHTLHANADISLAKGGESTKGWALGYEYAATPTVSLLAETYGAEGSKPVQAVGLRWAPTNDWSVGAMVSRPRLENGLNGRVTQLNTTVSYRF